MGIDGSAGSGDYTRHRDPVRKRMYFARHENGHKALMPVITTGGNRHRQMHNTIQKEYVSMYSFSELWQAYGSVWAGLTLVGFIRDYLQQCYKAMNAKQRNLV